MKQRHLTQVDVGGALGLSHTSVGRWCEGAIPRRRTALRLADFFGISVDDLLDDGRELPGLARGAKTELQVNEHIAHPGRRVIATDPSFSTGARQSSPVPAQLASISAELAALSAKLYSGEPPDNLRERLRANSELLHRLVDQY